LKIKEEKNLELHTIISEIESSRRRTTKCHLCRKKNYSRVRRTFADNKCKDKATKIGNSNLQG
jgi:hypothetical protein